VRIYKINHKYEEMGEVTCIEMLAVMFVIYVPMLVGTFASKKFGVWAGIVAGILSGVLCVSAVVLFYRDRGRRNEEKRRELRDRYSKIYRIVSLPGDGKNIKLAKGAAIKIGDYGWEAEPRNTKDGLVYLQGLTNKWRVVWYAGFQRDQIEIICPKPNSQYDWNYKWFREPPPCPFPVQERETTAMGLPNIYGWNGPRLK
jgi:hypothetical protein